MEKVKAVVEGVASYMSDLVPPRHVAAPDEWTAPPTPGSSFGVPDTTTEPASPTDPSAILDDITEQVDGVRGAILASVDGFGLARSASMADEASHPAMLAAAIGLARQLASMGGGDQLRQLVVDHDAGLMLVWPIGPHRVLAVLASSRVDQRQLRTVVQLGVATLAGVSP
jgi:uncharacterized protein